MSRWLKIKSNEVKNLPEGPGVFALYVDDKLVWISQGLNIRQRVKDGFRHAFYYKKVSPSKCFMKVSLSKSLGDWVLRDLRLMHKLAPKWNNVQHTWEDFRGLVHSDSGFLVLPKSFNVDPKASWMSTLRDLNMNNTEIARYLNKCQDKKRWTPIAVRNMLKRYDSALGKAA